MWIKTAQILQAGQCFIYLYFTFRVLRRCQWYVADAIQLKTREERREAKREISSSRFEDGTVEQSADLFNFKMTTLGDRSAYFIEDRVLGFIGNCRGEKKNIF